MVTPKKIILFALSLLSILMFIKCASAAGEITITYESRGDTIDWNGTATYYIIVTNHMSATETIRMRSGSLLWGDFNFEEPSVVVGPGASRGLLLKVIPPRDVLRGAYDLEVLAISSSDPMIRGSAIIRLNVISELPHIEPDYSLPDQLELGPTHVDLIVKNTGTKTESNLACKLESELFAEPVELEVGTLQPNDAKIVWQKDVDMPRNAGPGQVPITFVTYQNGREVTRSVQLFNVLPKEHIKVDDVVNGGFLKKKHTMTLVNDGNINILDGEYAIDVSPFAKIFTLSKPKMILSLNPTEISWAVTLKKGESMSVIYTTSYQPLFGILLSLLVLLYALAFFYKQEFSINKEVTSSGKDGKMIKIRVHIKNMSHQPQKDVIIEDLVPTPLTLVREFGTVQPSAIKKEKGHVKLVWKFGTLYRGDERVLSYGVRSALGLVGTVLLPAAKIKLKVDERTKIFHSNRVALKAHVAISDEPEAKPTD